MIEAWSARAAVFMKPGTTIVQFLPTETFNVSLTHGMAKSIQMSLELLGMEDNDEDDEKSARQKRDTYVQASSSLLTVDSKRNPTHALQNLTEFNISMKQWRSPKLGDDEYKTWVEKCPAKLTESLSVTPKGKEVFFGPPIGVPSMTMGIEITVNPEWGSITLFDCNTISDQMFSLAPVKEEEQKVEGGTPYLIVCVSVEFVGGQKLISVHSPAQFVNKTSMDILFCNTAVKGGESGWCPVLTFVELSIASFSFPIKSFFFLIK